MKKKTNPHKLLVLHIFLKELISFDLFVVGFYWANRTAGKELRIQSFGLKAFILETFKLHIFLDIFNT